MLRAIQRYLGDRDVRRRLIFTVVVLVGYRGLTFIPLPEHAGQVTSQLQKIVGTDLYFTLNIISGGALTQNAIVALSVGPYMAAASLLEFAKLFVPALQEWEKEGENGRDKWLKLLYALTAVVALLTAVGLTSFTGLGLTGIVRQLAAIASLVTGTMLTLWLLQQIDEAGVGSGLTMLVFSNTLYEVLYFLSTSALTWGLIRFVAVLAVIVVLILLYIYLREAQRRVPIQSTKRVRGNRVYGGHNSYIPFPVMQVKVDTVLTVYSDLLLIAGIFGIVQSLGGGALAEAAEGVIGVLSGESRYSLPVYFIATAVVATLTSYLRIGEQDLAEGLMRTGLFVPGLRPGLSTGRYLERIGSAASTVGVVFVSFVVLLPPLVELIVGTQVPLIIFIGVWGAIDTAIDLNREMEALEIMRQYEGFTSR